MCVYVFSQLDQKVYKLKDKMFHFNIISFFVKIHQIIVR